MIKLNKKDIDVSKFKFSVGPGMFMRADAFDPVRESIPLNEKIKKFKEIGFDAVQFHDDDRSEMNDLSDAAIKQKQKSKNY